MNKLLTGVLPSFQNVSNVPGQKLIFLTFCIFIDYYLLYAKLEEQYGLAKHAMDIYDRATRAVLPGEQLEVSD